MDGYTINTQRFVLHKISAQLTLWKLGKLERHNRERTSHPFPPLPETAGRTSHFALFFLYPLCRVLESVLFIKKLFKSSVNILCPLHHFLNDFPVVGHLGGFQKHQLTLENTLLSCPRYAVVSLSHGAVCPPLLVKPHTFWETLENMYVRRRLVETGWG